MPSWTKDQERAINERGGKIIVSAAAGSGKTAVLSERVINYILNGGSVSKLLVVTFTNAAAEEMKTRIKDKIEKAYLADKNNLHLKKELSLVDVSDITTMDAFYGKLVKNNFEKLKIDRDFNILSSEEEKIIIKNELKNLFENSFSNESFMELLSFFRSDNEELIGDIVLKINNFLNTVPNPKKVMDKILNNYSNDFYKELLFDDISKTIRSIKKLYEESVSDLYNDSDSFKKALVIFQKEIYYMNDLLNVKSLDELASRLNTITFDRLSAPSKMADNPYYIKLKSLREEFKSFIKDLNELRNMTDELYNNDMLICKDKLSLLFDLVNEFRKRVLNKKKMINSYSFSDISFFVIDLLINNDSKTPLARNLSEKYDEILIDEYQDTNNLQNIIFSAISKDNTNLFIVGDVKQSIYRFRSANPDIFNNDKKESYIDKFPKLITLSKNFRSRKEVLDFCNLVFETTMTEDFGGVNYDEKEKLYLGANFESSSNLDTEVIIIDGKEKIENEDIKNVEKEAIVVADRIKDLLDSNYNVYDVKKGSFRNIKQSDIVILLRSMTNSKYFIEALNNRGISVYSNDSSTYFDNYEVKLVINLLKIIDNPYDDVALMSVLYSKYVNMDINKIIDLRVNNKYDYLYNNLLLSSDEEIISFINTLKEIKEYSYNHELYELLNKIYKTFDLLSITLADKQGINKEKNLVQMIKHTKDYEKSGVKSLHEFIKYLEALNENKDSLEGINPLSDKNNVLITTIHKSKGLEYPVVFLSETGKKFNMPELKDEVMIKEEYGMVFKFIDNDYRLKYDSIPLMMFKKLEKNKALSEELRILYVALTRAKEKIIITGYSPNLENLVTKVSSKIGDEMLASSLYLKGVNNYLDILMPALLRHKSSSELRGLSSIDIKTFASESLLKIKVIESREINEVEFNNSKISCLTDFDINWYNKIKELVINGETIPQYLSVSEIKSKNTYMRNPNFMNDGISHTMIGTLYHKIFELLPIKKYSVILLEKELKKLFEKGFITKDELKEIDLEKIFAFLSSDLYDVLLNSSEVYREKEFSFEIPSSYYDINIKSGNILTSGIIDLLFVKDDTYYIIDYKTDNVHSLEELKERYKIQLDLYELAVKNIMKAKDVKKYIYSITLNKFIEC